MPDPADTAAGETRTVGNWNGAPGSTGSPSTSNNGSTSPGSSTSNNGGTQTSAPGKGDSQAKTSTTSNGTSSTPATKSQSTGQSISSPASSAAKSTSATTQTTTPTTTNAAAATTAAPATTSAPKVVDPSRGTMAGNPVTGATYTAGSPTPTYDANDGIVSMAEAEARYNAAQALNGALGIGPGTSAPSAPAAPGGLYGPRANPGADYISSVMGGILGPVGPVSPLSGTPPAKAITDRVNPAYGQSQLAMADPRRSIGTMPPSVPGSLPPSQEPQRTAGFTYDPARSMLQTIAGMPTVDVPKTDRLGTPANGSTFAQNNTGATGGLARDIQNAGIPTQAPPIRGVDMASAFPSDPRLNYPPGNYQGTVDGPPEYQTADAGPFASPSQDAGQPQTIGQLGTRIGYEYDRARDGFKNLPGKIYDAITGGNFSAPQDLAALQDQRGGGGGILPPDEQLDVDSLQKLMSELKRRGVSGNQQLKLILSTFV
jgi:hypothetical protein